MGNKERELPNGLKDKIVGALESPKFRYRTVGGMAAELQLSETTVQQTLAQLKDKLVAVPSRTAEGVSIFAYTTRRHHFGNMSIGERLLSALRNRA